MSPVSEKQRRYMGAHKNDPGKAGQVAREFMAADLGGKLPARVKDGKPVRKGKSGRK